MPELLAPIQMAPSYRVSFFSLGCRLNQSESAALASGFSSEGFDLVDTSSTADISVINTCSVTSDAEATCRGLIRRLLKKNPKVFIAVTGCYAQVGGDILKKVPGIDLIVGTEHKMDLPQLIHKAWEGGLPEKRPFPMVIHTSKISRREFTLPAYAAFDFATRPSIKIQDGCDFFCSFCIIPLTRGRERSRQFKDVLMEASLWAARGHREIVLTGVNLGQYQSAGKSLPDLIDALEQIDGISRIRISSIEPTTVSDRLLSQMAHSRKLCPYLHLPAQSGSNTILLAMARKYTREDYIHFVERAVAAVPGLGLGTDLMVGFPGEGEVEFQETLSLITRLPFSYLHVFPFSERKGTRVLRMGVPPVPSRLIRERTRLLCDLSKKLREKFCQGILGQTVEVLFETQSDPGRLAGYTPNYIRVEVESSRDLSGQVLPVVVTGVENGLAVGVLA